MVKRRTAGEYNFPKTLPPHLVAIWMFELLILTGLFIRYIVFPPPSPSWSDLTVRIVFGVWLVSFLFSIGFIIIKFKFDKKYSHLPDLTKGELLCRIFGSSGVIIFIFLTFYIIIGTSIIPSDKICVLVVITLLLSGILSVLLWKRKTSMKGSPQHNHEVK
jgi:hypothetical protein